jgi:hypothetical protein
MKRLALLALTAALLLPACGGGIPNPGPTPTPVPTSTPLPKLWPGPTLFIAQSHQYPFIVKGKPQVDTAELDTIAQGGFGGVRLGLIADPRFTPRSPDGKTWNFAGVDALYSAVLARGMLPLYILADPAHPSDVATLTEFAKEAAPRYPAALVELGNEPDGATWPVGTTPAVYWSWERDTLAAWKAAQPNAHITTGGTSGVDIAWNASLIAAIEADKKATGFDGFALLSAFGVHPYGEYIVQPPGVVGGNLGDDLTTLKGMLPANISVDLTEFGLPPWTPGDVTLWLGAAQTIGTPVFGVYEIRDNGQPFGLLNADLSHKVTGNPPNQGDPYAAAQAFLTPASPPPH